MSTLGERFLAFHATHPWVYAALEYLALSEVRRGATRLSIKKLYEQVRGTLHFPAAEENPENPSCPPKKIKMPNAHHAYYARELMKNNPELRGKFIIRPVAADFEGLPPPSPQGTLFPT
jgi:hypothetical protein